MRSSWQKIILRLVATGILLFGLLVSFYFAFGLIVYGVVLFTPATLPAVLLAVLICVSLWLLWSRKILSPVLVVSLVISGLFIGYLVGSFLYDNYYLRDMVEPASERANALEISYVGHARAGDVVLSIGYVFAEGFDDIYVGDNRYQKIGVGVYRRTTILDSNRPRYLVTERASVSSGEEQNWQPRRGNVQVVVFDRVSNKEVGKWNGPFSGWAGPQATKFLRSVLRPMGAPQSIGSHYPEVQAVISETSASLTVTKDDLKVGPSVRGCGELVSVAPYGTPFWELRISNVVFGFQESPDEILCSQDGVFIFSGTSPEDTRVSWLSSDGVLLEQMYSRGPEHLLDAGVNHTVVSSVVVAGNTLVVNKSYFKLRNTYPVNAERSVQITMPLHAGASGANNSYMDSSHK